MRSDVASSGGALQYEVLADRSVRLLKRHPSSVLPYYVTAMVQTADKNLWIGSTIICSYNGQTPAVFDRFLQGENTVKMVVDQQQRLWVAKEHLGVCRQEQNGWTVFGSAEGLPSLLINDLCLLQDGSLLASSDQGISRYDGTTWVSHAYPKWFGMSQPLSGVKQSRDGSIWLNYSYNEMWIFNHIGNAQRKKYTIRHRPERHPPETSIVKCLDRVSQPGNSHISWVGRDRWSQTPAEELQYSWRLDGGEWSAFSREPGKTFLNLESGRHVLEVRARDRMFNIDPTPVRAEFRVIAPIWRQAWFIVLMSVLIGLIVFLIWIVIKNREQYLIHQQTEREKHLLERQQEREALLLKQQEAKEQHLTEMDRIKTGFFTNISHELRTPMTVISGRLERLCASDIDEHTKSSLSIVLRNAQRVTALINQLLDFRKIQEGKIRIETTRGDLAVQLRDWVASMQVLAEQAQIVLSVDAPATCQGAFDFDKFQKIITNLIANAIKYTGAGGTVRVTLVTDWEYDGAQRLTLTVEDNGWGIPQEHLAHIFERFYRVSEASIAIGAGIGLNLTKELVDLLGGEIRVESPIHPDPERPGSRFTVRLPIQQEGLDVVVSDPSDLTDPSDPTDRMSQSSAEEAPLILIVEDDEDIRNFILEGLSSVYRLESAENGEIGRMKALEQVPDLVISDWMMPVLDGITLCRELKTRMETSHIPVILLTAKMALESQIEGLKTGADDYITKPFHLDVLRARIDNLLESRRLLREKFSRDYPVLQPVIPENTLDKEFLEKVRSVLEAHVSEWEFNPDQFAAEMNMSLRSLYRKLKGVADRTPVGFINEFRMKRAAELLLTTSHTITEIAFQVGCDESTNFARLFKAHHGVTPSQYRSGRRAS